MNCTKALIAVGGFGTRWLPLSKSIEKCMLPVGNRPVIDYIVDDCIAAGIKDIYFVVGEQSVQIRNYYGRNLALEAHLEKKGKIKELEQVRTVAQKANFHFIVQDTSMPYGTAIPVMLFKNTVELKPDEQVLVLMGDQFTYPKDGKSEAKMFMEHVADSGVSVGMGAVHVPREETYKYGILELTHHGHKNFLKQIIEHPTPEEAPSTLNNLSMYLFDAELFDCLQHIKPTKGEYYVIDALNIYVREHKKDVAVYAATGEYLDCGTVEGWLHANKFMAAHTSK